MLPTYLNPALLASLPGPGTWDLGERTLTSAFASFSEASGTQAAQEPSTCFCLITGEASSTTEGARTTLSSSRGLSLPLPPGSQPTAAKGKGFLVVAPPGGLICPAALSSSAPSGGFWGCCCLCQQQTHRRVSGISSGGESKPLREVLPKSTLQRHLRN